MSSQESVGYWRLRARRRLPRFIFDFIDGGAGDESAVRRNRAALKRLLLVPRRMVDVSTSDTRTKIFGCWYTAPLVIAPTGLNGLLWRQGDIALARAAAIAGVPFVLSTASTSRLEEVAASTQGEKWLQLYVLEDRRIAEHLLARAAYAGYTVLVLTVDVPINGDRRRDVRNGFGEPLTLNLRLALDAISRPRWLIQIVLRGVPDLANLTCPDVDASKVRSALLRRAIDRTLTWNSIDWLRRHWRGPIVLKGILSPADAVRSRGCGVNGIVVSNHGGRQSDAFPAAIDMLATITDSVGKHMEVLVDGGFRSGSDVIKGIALGARAVMIGRPILYALAAAGEVGAVSVLQMLKSDLERTMLLAGYQCISEVNRTDIVRSTEAQ